MMKSFEAVQSVGTTLNGLSAYAKSQNAQNNTSFAVFLENFAVQLVNIYSGESFQNLNQQTQNIKGIDFYSAAIEHGVQFTTESISFNKVKASVKKKPAQFSLKKLTVFFFIDKKVTDALKGKVETFKKQSNCAFDIEILSLKDIINMANSNAAVAYQLHNLCELWVNGRNNNYPDVADALNNEASKKVLANKNSRKYIPDVYVQEDNLKLFCRCICDENFLLQYIKIKLTAIQKGRNFRWLSDKKRINKDGTEVLP